MNKITEAMELARTATGRRDLRRWVRKRLHSQYESHCFRRDITVPFTPPRAKIHVDIRKLRPDDDLALLADASDLSREEALLRRDQRWMMAQDLPMPWVAIDPADTICMVTFLLTAHDNDRVRKVWGGWLPELAPDEGILEGIFTAETHRGLGLMSDAGTRMAEQYRDIGVRHMLGFIRVDNQASIRGAEKAGWTPHLRRVERWLLFRRTITFTPWNGELTGDERQVQVA